MNKLLCTLGFVFSICGIYSSAAYAASRPPQDPNIEVVLLRQDCTFYKRCFETIGELTAFGGGGWVWDTFQPSATKPLLISVGPGRFEGNFFCNSQSGVTVRGSGREQTTFVSTNAAGAVTLTGCSNIAFESLTLLGEGTAVRNGTVEVDSSQSTWTNVDIIAKSTGPRNVAWTDSGNCSAMTTTYFFDSRVWTLGASVNTYNFFSVCNDIWFYGGELLTDLYQTSGSNLSGAQEIFNLSASGIFRAFGTAIRLKASYVPSAPNALTPIIMDVDSDVSTPDVPTANAIVNIWQYNGAPNGKRQFHIHGGIINSSSSVDDIHVVSIYADESLTDDVLVAHTPDAAHNMAAGANAKPVRLQTAGTGRIESPFSWGSLSKPPLASDENNVLQSISGSDTYFENDCSDDGNCSGGGNESHLMIYDDVRCPSEIWFNNRTGNCRNVIQSPVDLADLKSRLELLEAAVFP